MSVYDSWDWAGLAFLAPIIVVWLWVLFRSNRRHDTRYRITGVDVARCERIGSQGENERRIRTAVGR